MHFDNTQTGVARGMAAAVAITIVIFLVAYLTQWPNPIDHADLGSRLRLASLSAMAPSASLFLCIARLAKHRFSTPKDIQGSALTDGTDRARLLQALLQNTLEQAALAVPLYFAASLTFPPTFLPMVPSAAALFLAGRLLFFRGYVAGATARAAGFGLTFYPSALLLITIIALALPPSAA